MHVTFDTNTLADVVSPGTSQRATGQENGTKVRAAIEAGRIQGVFCETMITLEGIKKLNRSAVFGSTVTNTTYAHGVAPDGNGITYINMKVEQLNRLSLDQRQAIRFLTAFGLGMKLLGAPRVGMVRVDDPDGSRYVAEADEIEIGRRMNKFHDIGAAIEARGLGCAQAQLIAEQIKSEVGGYEPFIFYLGKPRSAKEQSLINSAIAEWADGDSIAAHFGYGIEMFCTEDFGKSAPGPSILNAANREWLTQTYGIQFVTLGELAQMVTT